MDCGRREVSALVDRFMVLGARWCLSNIQVMQLLGIGAELDVMFDESDIVWALRRGGSDAERRVRLLVDVDALLVRLVPDARNVAVWLRTPDVGFEDDTVTPLEAMASGVAAIRDLRDYLQTLPAA